MADGLSDWKRTQARPPLPENYRNLKGHKQPSTKMKPKDTRFLDVTGSSGIKPTNTEGS
ncbi:hypothetical protein Egran_02725 [Elaphomyces granulatus]|uniref:Uncharacterized protein n=1 Tax=Elaphomyces granulatus TaxID=519963 RepID=A0A232LZB4_9EURO|nr:hypothetical protein Egran_02725 [Elaphomyces granulatus]